MRLAVLMFHALYRSERELRGLAAEERPYAVSEARFVETLDLIGSRGGHALGAVPRDPSEAAISGDGNGHRVLISFDDGHQSNYRYALPLLAERGIEGIFFVTSGFIDRRPGYCTWSELEEMATAGMQVGSHGVTHRFLDDLDEEQACRELSDSKRLIEDRTGREVNSISFPGGRYGRRELRLAREADYRHCYTSRFGTHRQRVPEIPFLVRRIAVRAGMSAQQTVAYAMGDAWPSLRRHSLEAIKSGARRILGNRVYQALYRMRAGP